MYNISLTTLLLLWCAIIAVLEYCMFRIFYGKTVRICFITEPDLPLSRFLTIGNIAILVTVHGILLSVCIIYMYHILW